jgi:hypothetical protein
MNSVGLLFCLYVLVLVLMSVKYLFIKEKLSNNDILIHLLLIVILGLLVLYTSNRERFNSPFDYRVSERDGVPRSTDNVNPSNTSSSASYIASNNMKSSIGSELYYSETAEMIEQHYEDGASLDYRLSAMNGVNHPTHSTTYAGDNSTNNNESHHPKNGAPLDYIVSDRNGVDSSTVTEFFSGAPLNYQVSSRNNVTRSAAAAVVAATTAATAEDLPPVYENGASLDYKMGPYSDVELDAEEHQHRKVLSPGFKHHMFLNEKKSDCGDLSSPCNVPLIGKPNYSDPMGNKGKLNLGYQDNNPPPSVDGTNDGPKSMFMFTNNVCHPGCCPSTYTCDHGCVCTNKQQRDYISRGGSVKHD